MRKLGIAEIYENTASLRDKVTYDDGGVDDECLARAEAAVAGLQEDYLVWADQDIDGIQQKCIDILALPADERAHSIGELFVVVHSVKGQGGSFGFPLITLIADSLSRFVEKRATFGAREMDVVNVHVSALRVVIAERLTGDGGLAGETMILGLTKVLEKFAAH